MKIYKLANELSINIKLVEDWRLRAKEFREKNPMHADNSEYYGMMVATYEEGVRQVWKELETELRGFLP